MSPPHNIALITRSLAGWRAKTTDYIREVFHEDLVYEDVPLRKVVTGLAEFEDFFTTSLTAFPDLEMTLITALADDERGAAEWRLEGAFLGAGSDFGAPTGHRFTIRGASIFGFKDGRILRVADYFDGDAFAKQLWPTAGRDGPG